VLDDAAHNLGPERMDGWKSGLGEHRKRVGGLKHFRGRTLDSEPQVRVRFQRICQNRETGYRTAGLLTNPLREIEECRAARHSGIRFTESIQRMKQSNWNGGAITREARVRFRRETRFRGVRHAVAESVAQSNLWTVRSSKEP